MLTKIIPVKLSKWFPCNDDLAKKIARLCIFREDLMFEFNCAIETRDVPIKDVYGKSWRLLYYFRRMISTTQEIRRAVESLALDNDFKSFLKKQPIKLQKDFSRLKKKMDLEKDKIKSLRREIGVHIDQEIIGEALQSMDDERHGYLHLSPRPADTHFKFVGELIISVMLRKTPQRRQEEKAIEVIDVLTGIIENLFNVVDWIIFRYLEDRKLIKLSG